MTGDHVQLTIVGINPQGISTGGMLCDPSQLVPVATRIRAQVLTLDLAVPWTMGVPVKLSIILCDNKGSFKF